MQVIILLEIFLIAVSLALDAFAVSVSSGISIPGFGGRQAVKMGVWFGGFQFAMPLIGWLLGTSVSQYIKAVDHWVAFALLAIIGGRMVWGALRRGAGEEEEAPGRVHGLYECAGAPLRCGHRCGGLCAVCGGRPGGP